MKITRSAFEKAVKSNLAVGKRVDSAEVRKTLQKIGIDTRFKGQVKESQLKTAFETLKEKGLLKERSRGAGERVFVSEVKKEVHSEAEPGISKERKLAFAKARLRDRLDEEAAKKARIDEALSGKPLSEQKKHDSRPPAHLQSSGVQGLGSANQESQSSRQNQTSSLGGGPSYQPVPGQVFPEKMVVPEPPDMFGPDE